MKTKLRNSIYGLLPIAVTLVCFGLLPNAQAVDPPPDGGYPGGNTAEGTDALFTLTTGVSNTGLGFKALYHDTTGDANTATGREALFSNTTGDANMATGRQALFGNPSVLTRSTTRPEAVTRPLVSQLATSSRATAMSASAGAYMALLARITPLAFATSLTRCSLLWE